VENDLFLYSYEADFIQGLLKKNKKKLARSFNSTFRYIDDVLSLNNSSFGDFVVQQCCYKDNQIIILNLTHNISIFHESNVVCILLVLQES
jgi:hypothetical protein